MKFQVEVVIKDDAGRELPRSVIFERLCGSLDGVMGGLGLSLGESKTLAPIFTVLRRPAREALDPMDGR